MEKSIIAAVQNCGFDVYMRDAEKDGWLYFTDGKNVGYLQANRLEPPSLSTVHIPNTKVGTGFRVERTAPQITREDLARAFVDAPGWASSEQRQAVQKWPSLAAFLSADNFNRGYRLVPAQS